MKQIIRKSKFKKQFKKVQNNKRVLKVLASVIDTLKAGKLPSHRAPLKNHKLTGNLEGKYTVHLSGDNQFIMIYEIGDESITLLAIGSHGDVGT